MTLFALGVWCGGWGAYKKWGGGPCKGFTLGALAACLAYFATHYAAAFLAASA